MRFTTRNSSNILYLVKETLDVMSIIQQYPVNLYLSNNEKNVIVFIFKLAEGPGVAREKFFYFFYLKFFF